MHGFYITDYMETDRKNGVASGSLGALCDAQAEQNNTPLHPAASLRLKLAASRINY